MIPKNEAEVIFRFAQDMPKGWEVLELHSTRYPDGKLQVNGHVYNIEFEFQSSNFVRHRHDILKCDLIICWENDWGGNSPIPILALKTGIEEINLSKKIDYEKAMKYERKLRESLEYQVTMLENKVDSLEQSLTKKKWDNEPIQKTVDTEQCQYCDKMLQVGKDGTTKRAMNAHRRACPNYEEGDF